MGERAGKGFRVAKIAGYPEGMWGAEGRRKLLRRGGGEIEKASEHEEGESKHRAEASKPPRKNQEGVWEVSLASGVCEAHPAGQMLGQGLQSPLGEPVVSLGHERHNACCVPWQLGLIGSSSPYPL